MSFCYTGGFTLAALAGGATRVVSIDSSAEALALARENVARNPALAGRSRASGARRTPSPSCASCATAAPAFDLIVLDPPKFAPTAAHAERAARAYKDVNLLALKLLRPGGLLATFSCSGGIDADLFRKIVAGAALDAGVDAHGHRHSSAREPTIRWRSRFPKATTSRGSCSANRRDRRARARTKQGPSRLPGGALSVAAGWTGGHPAVFGHCVFSRRVRPVLRQPFMHSLT